MVQELLQQRNLSMQNLVSKVGTDDGASQRDEFASVEEVVKAKVGCRCHSAQSGCPARQLLMQVTVFA